jgi:DNA-directed RNA polymerase subunit RPC12/RpoP
MRGSVNVIFACPECESPARVALDAASDWQCPHCDHRIHFDAAEPKVSACAACGNRELYKQKDFPHRIGMLILVVPLIVSLYTYLMYEKWLTYAILIGSAIVDGALYLWVGDAVVCYRCGAYHKGFPSDADHHPFEIAIGERYRQERLRKERIRDEQLRGRQGGG